MPLQLLFSCDGCRPLRWVSLFLSILGKSIACSHSPLLTNSCDVFSAPVLWGPALPQSCRVRWPAFPHSVKGGSPAAFSSPAGVNQSWRRFGAQVCT